MRLVLIQLGKCLNNTKFPPSISDKYNDEAFISLLKKYKFYLCMENSNCQDYVTEKLFRTLRVGLVPIIDGPRYRINRITVNQLETIPPLFLMKNPSSK